jgi:hypothetical protein
VQLLLNAASSTEGMGISDERRGREAICPETENQMKQDNQKTVKDVKVAEQEVLKIQEFVQKLGGIERAKLAVEELARLKKTA